MTAPALVDDSVSVTLPIRTRSESNMREHWAAKHRRAKSQRLTVALTLRPQVIPLRGFAALNVMLTRVAPRRLDDDNLRGALKAVRDGVADALGVNDADERVTWLYAQRSGPPKAYEVHIAVWMP